MTELPESRAIISGIGISRIGRRTGIPGLELTVEASRRAIADAGLDPADIDGVATLGETPPRDACAALGLAPAYLGGGFEAGALLAPVMAAVRAVAAGQARHVLVYRTVQMLGGVVLPGGDANHLSGATADEAPAARTSSTRAYPARDGQAGGLAQLMTHRAYSAANWLALHCRRHMYQYGTTKEQLGALAINSRRNAGLNPLAVYRSPITLDDYLSARPVSDPFGLLDCDVPIDGSVALVVSAADHASACEHPVRIEAMGGSTGPGGWYFRPDYPKMASADAAAEMWSRTALRPSDVDFAELYDGFTFLTLAWLEAFGFCGDGESGPFVADPGRIALEGSFPINTYGGQLSAGRMHGYWIVHEACLQLRGQAGERQVARHQVAAVGVGGGPIAGALLLAAG
ncbi:thiolase family protein [Frankia sp. CNm7]|uniref:Thiolase family protein n=1 Tax=Frankia nepalensis TaxID=1836974 RepID=A0A937UW27_9ACTN|nr:thiolase family protein [Frankia nepalensis]MBL7501834.1 thiolase family protein [Frankia nepalensis]MBL7514090.1 thiolase family protein [Frankia nepalensis]MBL7522872.1 thiolase family protein [Frankia nepalensis]MBL7632941.1 thiolase family protein [Frankia nepalensis]